MKEPLGAIRMPIYEFFCEPCNTIFNFFSRSVNTEKIPQCPKCGNAEMKRKVSLFAAISGGQKKGSVEEDLPSFDESRMEQAMAVLAREAEEIDENDPRQAASLMRKLSETTGLNMGPGMEEALNRMERGEDPDKIEEELGDLLEKEEPFLLEKKKQSALKKKRPKVDETLYDLWIRN